MSRVYEALKNAQDQRTSRPPLDSATTVESEISEAVHNTKTSRRIPEILAAVRSEASAGKAEAPASQAAKTATPSGPLQLNDLLQRCTKPIWKPKTQWSVFSSERPAERQAEQFRTLRAHLYTLRENQRLSTLLLTSTTVGEGKTFVALNLAQSIARQQGRRALLVDADLRAPKLHVALGAPSEPGLSDYLAGEADECSVIQADTRDELFFIPAGRPCSDPAELLANNQLQTLFSRIGPLFDWVILDAPPMLPVSDAGVLAGMCDGVIFIVRAGTAGFDKAQSACSELKQRNLLGVVLNGVEEQAIYGGYGYY
ncbi:MAG TPA: CpsD/CapB family tyrosine-protein kinase [Terriglobales bacterium]|jgi:capsular exopolysaccharide synthesis family protein|nr:CpsD/CapB family tyrosine-protein kinase [Terriglobales bacterium]